MAKYMLLIHGDAAQWEAMTPEQWKVYDAAHEAFSAAAGSRILSAGQLEPAPNATTVRTDGAGELLTTDGPFLDTKEALGGFYLIEAADLDEVLELTAMLAEVRDSHTAVEIRPLVSRE
jgi:hypothetical protein